MPQARSAQAFAALESIPRTLNQSLASDEYLCQPSGSRDISVPDGGEMSCFDDDVGLPIGDGDSDDDSCLGVKTTILSRGNELHIDEQDSIARQRSRSYLCH